MYRTLVLFILLGLGLSGYAESHQFTPTYPEWESSYEPGIVVTTMVLFNRREEINYYQINVFDKDWAKIPFATSTRLLYVPYLESANIEIYLRDEDVAAAMYICSHSKILIGSKQASQISSKICSKLK